MGTFNNNNSGLRLADYFAILTLDETQIRHGQSVGIIKQRFPLQEWDDVPFAQSIQMFCMPQTWSLSAEKKDPIFFVATLTDVMGAHQYIFCLQTYEPWIPPADFDDDQNSTIETYSLFKPTVFVLISRYPFVELFRICLNIIFNAMKDPEGENTAAKYIGTLIGGVKLNDGPQSFRLGEETFTVRAPLQSTLPMTNCRIWSLTKNLGSIHNLLLLFRCVLSEQKIILHSCSLNRLFDASYALRALIYPLEYVHTLVSVLPEPLLGYLESPTPYMMGILTSSLPKIPSVESILVDLDLGEIIVSNGIHVPDIPVPFSETLIKRLQLVLNADLKSEDNAIPPPNTPMEDSFTSDKKIRACFLSFFVELLHGYRTCLELVRLYEQPIIVFHQSAFLGMRRLSDSFIKQVLNSQMFQLFTSSRGVPYRQCDYFDELISKSFKKSSTNNDNDNISAIADVLTQNEKQTHNVSSLYWRPNKQHRNGYDPEITIDYSLNQNLVDSFIENMNNNNCQSKIIKNCNSNVPDEGFSIDSDQKPVNSRRLQVLEKCIDAIFDNRLVEARKVMSAVERSLNLVEARVFLCRSLSKSAMPVSKATLSSPQFELVVRLLNYALDQETPDDEHGIAYACLHLSNIYCRVLSQGVFQFIYTCIQNHPVWKSHKFWESSFFHDVHLLVKKHYSEDTTPTEYGLEGNGRRDLWNLQNLPNSMKLAAERLRMNVNEKLMKEDMQMEDYIVHGQAKHYINLMIYLRVPLDIMSLDFVDADKYEKRSAYVNPKRERSLSNTTSEEFQYSVSDVERKNCIDGVTTWISRMIDGICSATRLESNLIHKLIQDIPHFACLHLESLEQVYHESKKLIPISKPSLLKPILHAPYEKMLIDGLRCILLDSLNENNKCGSSMILPAEGAIFLTNYRVIFKGKPMNSHIMEKIVIGAPIMSIMKKKTLSDQFLKKLLDKVPVKNTQGLHSAMNLRTTCFQSLYFVFDEEVSSLEVENYWKRLSSVRWPATIPQSLFAYSLDQFSSGDTANLIVKSNKFPTMRDFGLSLLKPNKAGSVFRNFDPNKWSGLHRPSKTRMTLPDNDGTLTTEKLEHQSYWAVDPGRPYIHDYDRLKSRNAIRCSFANNHYDLSKSLPSCVLVPTSISDDFLLKMCKNYKHGRIPVITWASEDGALLVRGSSYSGTTVITKIKKQASMLHRTESSASFASSNRMQGILSKEDMESVSSSNTYQQQFFNCLIEMSPTIQEPFDNSLTQFSESLISLISTELGNQAALSTPNITEKKSSHSDMVKNNFLRNSARASNIFSSLSTKSIAVADHVSLKDNIRGISESRKRLYILVDKTNQKMLESNDDMDILVINYPSTTDMKAIFKKLCRVVQPCLSVVNSFLLSFHETGWLQMVRELISISTSVTSIMACLNSSVAMCFEDGWDATCQVSSLSQLLLDPYYRTIEGFGILIEKEWLAFGHRFSYRANHSISSLNSELAPVFLLFLDSVHQVMTQFPNAFEFNDFFLRFLAYHSSSAFFRTFLLDCEADRLFVEKISPDLDHKGNIWAYIASKTSKSAIFLNFKYDQHCSHVLYPSVSMASMDIWSYFTNNCFSNGVPYDIDLAERECKENSQCELLYENRDTKIISMDIGYIDIKENRNVSQLDQARKRGSIDKGKTNGFSKSNENTATELNDHKFQQYYNDFDKHMQRIYQKKAMFRLLQSKVSNNSDSPKSRKLALIVHQGYLSKKGARIKLKTDRWYVLDSASRQLIVYDNQLDKHPRSSIQLADIKSVDLETTGTKHILVLNTCKRVYHLQASTYSDAEIWKNKIEHLLHDDRN